MRHKRTRRLTEIEPKYAIYRAIEDEYPEISTCAKGSTDYPELENRSIFYPYSSVGKITFMFDVVEDTGSNLTSSLSFIERLRVGP